MKNLAISLRPTTLDGVLGMPKIVSAIKQQLDSGTTPSGWLFIGEPGVGKTTLAYIIAKMIQGSDFTEQPEIIEINAAVDNGVGFYRELIPRTEYHPMVGKFRVILINEIQRLTDEAQQALLVPLENDSSTTVWIFTTTDPSKIIPALLSRCGSATYKLPGLDATGRLQLIQQTAKVAFNTDILPSLTPIVQAIESANIVSGRDIVCAVEMYANGLTPEEAVLSADANPEYALLAKSILFDSWGSVRLKLLKLKASDAKPLRQVLSSFAKTTLLTHNTPCGSLLKELSLYQTYEAGVDLGALIGVIHSYKMKDSK